MYIIATVSNQVQSNHIAWSQKVGEAATLEKAQELANAVFAEMQKEFEQRADFDGGAVMGESVIIHDGQNIF